MKNPFNVMNGAIIQGKWHRNSYNVLKELGSGANGTVYLVDWNGKKAAMKISFEPITVTSEVNVLKSFSKAQGFSLGPSLLDVDDWVVGNNQFSFYVMEYVDGLHFISFIKQSGMTWLPLLILQLLSDLGNLHKLGWIFGDLKPDNLIVSGPPIKIRCIDVGGTTANGRAIKEYTEFFDRGYWGLGSRKAEASYDLFAVAMIMINSCYPQRFSKQEGGLSQLTRAIDASSELKKYKPVLLKALSGKYLTATDMRNDLLDLLNNGVATSGTRASKTQRSYVKSKSIRGRTLNPSVSQRIVHKRKKRGKGILETILILAIITLLYAFYIYEQIL